MTPTYSLRDFAERIATAEGFSLPADRLFLQLKGLAGRGLLTPEEFYGPRGARLYLEGEAYKARLLLAAIDAGFEATNLDRIASAIEEYLLALGSALALQPAPECRLEVSVIRQAPSGEQGVFPSWRIGGEHRGPGADPLAAGDDAFSVAGTLESIVIIRASAILLPLFKEFRKG